MAIPTNGLDFYLPFDTDLDEKIHSLTGTLSSSNAATYFMLSQDATVGKFLRCIKTQGSSSYYLKYPNSENLMQYGTGDFSLSFWMRAPDWGHFTNVVFEKKYNDNYDGFVVSKIVEALNLCCRMAKGSGENSVDIVTASAANSDKFVHWCFIRDASGGRWYCNGLQEAASGELIDACEEADCNVDPSRAIGVNVSNSEIFKIGYSAAWSWKQSVFDLKALRIYNRALTGSEITELSREFSTTGGSLDTVLSALDGARDALVTAINAKGGSLADNATLYQCADAVGSLSGGTSAEYYKCAGVDTSAKTWSGYKAEWGDNGYTISDDLTEGLVYSGMTPQVGTIYNSTCSVRVAALYSNLAVEPELPVFYAPLMTDTSIEINPSSMTTGSGNVSFSTVDGVPTAVLDSGFLLWDKDSTLPNGNHEISISFGLRLTQTMENKLIFFYGSNDGYNGLGLQVNGTSITMSTKEGNNLIGDTQELQLDTWYHILVTYTTDGMWKLYINGTLKTSSSKSLTLSSSYNFNFGNYIWSGSWRNLYACITRARIYDYAIDDTYNIAWLMQEIGVS